MFCKEFAHEGGVFGKFRIGFPEKHAPSGEDFFTLHGGLTGKKEFVHASPIFYYAPIA